MRSEKDQIKSPSILAVPDKKHLSAEDHNYMFRWADRKDFGTKKGYLGLKKGTTGRFFSFADFIEQTGKIQSK